MKRLIIALVAGVVFSATFADEAFDNLKKLAATPKDKLTAANIAEVVDAGIAVTNHTSIISALDLKLMTVADIFAKTKGKLDLANVQQIVANKYGTDAEKVEAFNDAVDLFIGASEEDQKKLYHVVVQYCAWNSKNGSIMSKVDNEAFTAAVEKIAASDAKWKWTAVNGMLFVFGKINYSNNEALAAKYAPSILAAAKAGDFLEVYQILDFADYLMDMKDLDSVKVIVGNPKWFTLPSIRSSATPKHIHYYDTRFEPEISTVRKEFISKISTNERGMINVARAQDKVDGNKDATAKLCWPRLENVSNKVEVALYLGDNDKLIDTLMTIDNTLDAETINKAITSINALDPDWRAADVLKALRVINKKYTLKLYDDRDTWEPVLSKVRALIDTYNN